MQTRSNLSGELADPCEICPIGDERECQTMSQRPWRAAVVWLATCGWLAAGGAGRLLGAEKTISHAGTVESSRFNVLSYGAVGDNKTDNTGAFSACLKAVIDAGGGRIYLPAGVVIHTVVSSAVV